MFAEVEVNGCAFRDIWLALRADILGHHHGQTRVQRGQHVLHVPHVPEGKVATHQGSLRIVQREAHQPGHTDVFGSSNPNDQIQGRSLGEPRIHLHALAFVFDPKDLARKQGVGLFLNLDLEATGRQDAFRNPGVLPFGNAHTLTWRGDAVRGQENVPPHLELDKTKLSAKISAKTDREWVAIEINELLVVEYYSRKV